MNRKGQGFCVWLTGLSGAGKSTIAAALDQEFRGLGREVVVFDGDAVRSRISTDLGFTREDRDANVARVAVKAAEVVNGSGIAICALMSPYTASRNRARDLIRPDRFVLVYVATPFEVCERRDVKGLYAKARQGQLRHFVGLDEPYEPPLDADARVDTSTGSVDTHMRTILDVLIHRSIEL